MLLERKVDQPAELPRLRWPQYLSAHNLEADIVCCPSGFGIAVQIPKIVRHGEVKQGQTIIKNRRRPGDLTELPQPGRTNGRRSGPGRRCTA